MFAIDFKYTIGFNRTVVEYHLLVRAPVRFDINHLYFITGLGFAE